MRCARTDLAFFGWIERDSRCISPTFCPCTPQEPIKSAAPTNTATNSFILSPLLVITIPPVRQRPSRLSFSEFVPALLAARRVLDLARLPRSRRLQVPTSPPRRAGEVSGRWCLPLLATR